MLSHSASKGRRWVDATAWSLECSSETPGTSCYPRSGRSSPKPELMSSAGSDRFFVDRLSCLHVVLTNITWRILITYVSSLPGVLQPL